MLYIHICVIRNYRAAPKSATVVTCRVQADRYKTYSILLFSYIRTYFFKPNWCSWQVPRPNTYLLSHFPNIQSWIFFPRQLKLFSVGKQEFNLMRNSVGDGIWEVETRRLVPDNQVVSITLVKRVLRGHESSSADKNFHYKSCQPKLMFADSWWSSPPPQH